MLFARIGRVSVSVAVAALFACMSPGEEFYAGGEGSGSVSGPLVEHPTFGSATGTEAVPDSVIVRFAPTANREARVRVRARVSAAVVRNYDRLVSGLQVWQLPSGSNVDRTLQRLSRDRDVLYAHPNYRVQALQTIPNDRMFDALWGMHNTGQTGGSSGADIDGPEAWEVSTGSRDIVVAVVDTGIDARHEDLAVNMWRNPGEVPGNGQDDDGNGYVDDVHGINAINGSGNPSDDNGHGTHCAGTIGAAGNNGTGVVGVNWSVSLMGVKFLSASGGGSLADAIESIDYTVMMKRDHGINIRVLSNSWGGGGFNRGLLDAINAAGAEDMLFVAAAGNSASDNDRAPMYPASYDSPHIVSVASTTHTDAMSNFSSYGRTTVDLGAPGSEIQSTVPGNRYDTFSGTSMATPHVAGAAALVLSHNSSVSALQVKEALLNSVDAIPALSGKTVSGGRLNVASALATVAPPGPSFRLNVEPGSDRIGVGEGASFTIGTEARSGFRGDINLAINAVPPLNGATLRLSPSTVPVGANATLTVLTTGATAPGVYELTVTGTSGALSHRVSAVLTVEPANLQTLDPEMRPGLPIPDNDANGVSSTIDISDELTIWEARVAVDVRHPWIGDLIVTLTSPAGTETTVHNRGGGSTDDINETFDVNELAGESTRGQWTLRVSDNAWADRGTFDRWQLLISGYGEGDDDDTQPPSVAITAPNDGATVTGNIAIEADASDNVGVTQVDFYRGSTLLGTDVSAPYAWTWDTRGVANGTHSLQARARDAAGNEASSAVVSVVVENGATPGDLVLNWSFETDDASDAIGVTDVQNTNVTFGPGIVGDRAAVFNGRSSDLLIDWNNVPTGAFTVSMWVKTQTQTDGQIFCHQLGRANVLFSRHFRLGVFATWWEGMLPTDVVPEVDRWYMLTLTYDPAFRSDNTALYVDGVLKATRSTRTDRGLIDTPWRLGRKAERRHEFVRGSIDDFTIWSRALSADEVLERYRNQLPGEDQEPPSVDITAPRDGATVRGSVNIGASATDNIGVSEVAFYVDGTLLGRDTSAPYTFSWDSTAVADGSYALSARARDAAGNVGDSEIVTVHVENGGAPDGPVLHWSFESPDASDAIGITDVQNTDVTFGQGVVGRHAAVFNGRTSDLLIDWNYIPRGAFTVSLWVKTDKPQGGQIFCQQPRAGSMLSRHYGSGTLATWWRGQLATDVMPELGRWYMFTITYDPSFASDNTALYVDGVLKATRSTRTNRGLKRAPWRLGRKAERMQGMLKGSLDEFSIWDRALTAQQVRDLYRDQAPGGR